MTKLFASPAYLLVAAIACAGASAPALCVDDTDPMTTPKSPATGSKQAVQGAPTTPAGGGGFLSGPTVPPGAAKGDGSFGAGDGKRAQGGDRLAFVMQDIRVFRDAMMTVTPTLSEDQRTRIETLGSAFQAEAMAWRTANADKIKAIEEKYHAARSAGKGSRPGEPGAGKPDGAMPDGAKPDGARPDRSKPDGARPDPAMMQEMQKLKSTMPKFEPVREQIMSILTPDQQAAVKAAVSKMNKGRGDGKGPGGRRPGAKGGDDAPAKAAPPADPPKGDYKFKD
ncbi:MAG: hypothetical protein EXS03_08820 [Phycisphaerales bacterium]|nr:hypothetical protein [Phycisphaerales bacterium]